MSPAGQEIEIQTTQPVGVHAFQYRGGGCAPPRHPARSRRGRPSPPAPRSSHAGALRRLAARIRAASHTLCDRHTCRAGCASSVRQDAVQLGTRRCRRMYRRSSRQQAAAARSAPGHSPRHGIRSGRPARATHERGRGSDAEERAESRAGGDDCRRAPRPRRGTPGPRHGEEGAVLDAVHTAATACSTAASACAWTSPAAGCVRLLDDEPQLLEGELTTSMSMPGVVPPPRPSP